MQVFTLPVLPAHPAQIPVLTNNVTVQGREDRPRQNGQQFISVMKGHGEQVHFIARPHLCRPPCGTHLGSKFLNAASATTAAAAAVTVAAAASCGTATR